MHPDDIGRIEAGRDEAIAKHAPFDLEFRGRHSTGEYRWISTKGGAIYDEAGKAIRVFGVNIDITERKRAEETLREQATLLHLAHDAIIVWSNGDKITFWNHGAQETYGWTREEAAGHVPQDLLQTQFSRPLVEIRADVAAKGGWEGELTQTRKDGRKIVVASRWAVQRDESGDQVGVLEINRDITERKKIEAALEASNKELKRFNNATVGRELRMIELKKEINDLCAQFGQPARYDPIP